MNSSSSYKNIVIVGAVSGTNAVQFLRNKLPDGYRIILIDRQTNVFYPVAALRAAVLPGWEERVHTSFQGIFGKRSRHLALPGTTIVELEERSVRVDKEHPELGLGFDIPFEYAILAMGASQASPARASGTTGDEISRTLRDTQKSVASASGVLVIGGGPAGIEFAAEVKELYPQIPVTLVHRSSHLARTVPGVHEKALPVLSSMGINVILEDTVVLPEGFEPSDPIHKTRTFQTMRGTEIEASYVYLATGNKANNELVAKVDPAAIAKNGCVKVKLTFEVDSPKLKYYFAMGDLADVPEIKLLGGSRRHARVVAANICSLIAGKHPTRLHTPRPNAGTITLGLHDSVFYCPWFAFSGWLANLFHAKDLGTGRWLRWYNSKP